MKNLLIIILSLLLFSSSNAEILKTKDPKALCSNGKQATFNFYENKSNNWLIYFQGGGVAANADMYKGRSKEMKSPASSDKRGYDFMVQDFFENGFNVIYVSYCSNDLYQGMHINKIDGVDVYFHGRYIVDDIFKQYDDKFLKADKLVFAGHSAGSLALGFNVDLISKYENPYLIPDSFWLDAESLRVRQGLKGGLWDGIEKFLYNNRFDHCKNSHWANCFPSKPLFDQHKIKNIFFIWNIGDPYIKGDLEMVRQSIKKDSDYYNAGFSVNAEQKKMKAFENWGHVMTANDLYFKDFDGITLQKLIWNWINGSGQTSYINN